MNPSLLPEDYYLVRLNSKATTPGLELNQNSKSIIIDSYSRLPLAQKIILDQKLYQYVLHKGDVEPLTDKFNSTEFIVEKMEV